MYSVRLVVFFQALRRLATCKALANCKRVADGFWQVSARWGSSRTRLGLPRFIPRHPGTVPWKRSESVAVQRQKIETASH